MSDSYSLVGNFVNRLIFLLIANFRANIRTVLTQFNIFNYEDQFAMKEDSYIYHNEYSYMSDHKVLFMITLYTELIKTIQIYFQIIYIFLLFITL